MTHLEHGLVRVRVGVRVRVEVRVEVRAKARNRVRVRVSVSSMASPSGSLAPGSACAPLSHATTSHASPRSASLRWKLSAPLPAPTSRRVGSG